MDVLLGDYMKKDRWGRWSCLVAVPPGQSLMPGWEGPVMVANWQGGEGQRRVRITKPAVFHNLGRKQGRYDHLAQLDEERGEMRLLMAMGEVL